MNYINPTTYPPTVEGNTVGEEGQVDLQDRGKYEITIHDQMNEAFVDMTTPVVMLDRAGDKNDVTLTQDTNYTYITTTDDGCTFHIVIDLIALYENGIITDADITNATPITVTYTAKLNKRYYSGQLRKTPLGLLIREMNRKNPRSLWTPTASRSSSTTQLILPSV